MRVRALPASSRSGRGMACPLLILDEIAHALDTEGNAAGGSLYQALSPSVAQFGTLGKILLLSSPWFQAGIFWDLYKQADSGQYPYMQCVNRPTWEVNPTRGLRSSRSKSNAKPSSFLDKDNGCPINSVVWKHQSSLSSRV